MTNIGKEFLKNKKKLRKLLTISIKQCRERGTHMIQKCPFDFEFDDINSIFLTD